MKIVKVFILIVLLLLNFVPELALSKSAESGVSNFQYILDSIKVIPDNDTALQAGESINFSAEGYDEFGNIIEGLTFIWSLSECSNCIGQFSDSTLYVTRVGQGRAIASSAGVTGMSGLITVVPGELNRMVLSISDTQFVGQPLRPSAAIILYDQYNNLKSDYSLSDEPISLIVETGALEPEVLNDNNIQIGGVVRLFSADIKYRGRSTSTNFYATNGTVISDTVNLFFNGYDILDALNVQGMTISEVFVGHQTSVFVPIQNQGNIDPAGMLTVRSYYKSGISVNEDNIIPPSVGEIDTIEISLPVLEQSQYDDTLVLELEADFTVDGQSFITIDTQFFPVTVLSPGVFNVVDDSFKPDTILRGLTFEIMFDVFAEGFNQVIDSTYLEIQLLVDHGGDSLVTIYKGSPNYTSYEEGVIGYKFLLGRLENTVEGTNGWHFLKFNYNLYSAGNLFNLENDINDSIYVIFDIGLSFISESLTPTEVTVGTEVSFSFDVNLDNSFPLVFNSEVSSFDVIGDGFSTKTQLVLDSDSIYPGVNHLQSEDIFIPPNQLGNELNLKSSIYYTIPGIPHPLSLRIYFDSTTIPVTALPVVQIIDVDVIAPNKPKVNTRQNIQIACKVANLSNTLLDSLILNLQSDGSSTFEPELKVFNIAVYDTVEVLYNVTTAASSNLAEIFQLSIVSSDVTQLSSVDDIAHIKIETPASLDLTHQMLNIENSMIAYGSDVNFSVEIVNLGEAEVTDGAYILTVEGIDLDGVDTISGNISVDQSIDFSFTSPEYDTTLTFNFNLTSIPIDLNINQPASVIDTSFEFSLMVILSEAELHIEPVSLGNNLVLPGRKKELFQLNFANTGVSSVTEIRLEEIELFVKNGNDEPINVREVLNIGNTGFYENDEKVALTTGGGNRIVFTFEQFNLLPMESRSIVLITEFKKTNEKSINFELLKDGITVHFTAGPNAGLAPVITSDVEGLSLISAMLSVKGATLGSSFMISTNPFNPNDPADSPVEFSYELSEAASIEFRIFTLTGEEVYIRNYTENVSGGMVGENIIEWNGRNNEDRIVLNGVYVALLTNVNTGEQARIKIAVVK